MKIVQATGQTSNQLWIYHHYIADSLATGEKLAILAPDINFVDFPELKNHDLIKFPFYSGFLSDILGSKHYLKLLAKIFGNKYILKLYPLLFSFVPYVRYYEGKLGEYTSLNRFQHKNQLKKIFSPDSNTVEVVKNLMESIRKRHELIIGVHIRRGDYRAYRNGVYYYTDEQYHKLLLETKSLFPDVNIAFFIASNEDLNLEYFTDCCCFTLKHGSGIADQYALSEVDFLIGPPSTYSGWASFYGDVPIYFVNNIKEKVTRNSFRNILTYFPT